MEGHMKITFIGADHAMLFRPATRTYLLTAEWSREPTIMRIRNFP